MTDFTGGPVDWWTDCLAGLVSLADEHFLDATHIW